MRRALLSLLLIVTMVLAVTIASAQNFSAAGDITAANGWYHWHVGRTARAMHGAVPGPRHQRLRPMVCTTGASGAFELQRRFQDRRRSQYREDRASRPQPARSIRSNANGYFWFNGAKLGPAMRSDSNDYIVKITSDDGKRLAGTDVRRLGRRQRRLLPRQGNSGVNQGRPCTGKVAPSFTG